MTWVLDLDGVVWLAEQPIDGARAAVATLRAAGRRVLFATNNSSVPVAEQEAKLARHGIAAHGEGRWRCGTATPTPSRWADRKSVV